MVDTLPANPPPDGYTVKTTIDLWQAEFGDGYSQRAPRGLNHIKRAFPLVWTNLTDEEKDVLKNFFKAHSDGSSWYYTLPDEVTPGRYTLVDYDIQYEGANTFQVTANIKEVFDV